MLRRGRNMKKIFTILILQILMFSTIGAIAIPNLSYSDDKFINESLTISIPSVGSQDSIVLYSIYVLFPG